MLGNDAFYCTKIGFKIDFNHFKLIAKISPEQLIILPIL